MQSNQEFKYVGSFKRSFAAAMDTLIANLIRMVVVMFLSALWMSQQVSNFQNDFKAKFDSQIIGKDPDKIQFLMQHSVFKSALLFCFVVFMSGALYYILMGCSKWRGGVGKKLMKIAIVKNDGTKLTLLESASHYFLSIVPWFFIFYIFTYHMMRGINLYNAITENTFNLIFGLITLAWLQIHMVTKKKTTAADLICKTIVIKA